MLEKVANAICERRNANDWPCNGLDFDTEMAKTAINALREPTQDILKEMAYNSGAGFNKMWDAALDQIINPS